MSGPIILWFRQDLRLDDHLALLAACETGAPVLPVFIDDEPGRPLGSASQWWLAQSLRALDTSLRAKGAQLFYFKGDSARVLKALVGETSARGVYWSRCYEPSYIERDTAIKAELRDIGVDAQSFSGHLLFEPWQVKNKSGQPFKVFSPFWKTCRAMGVARPPKAAPSAIAGFVGTIDALDWAKAPLPEPVNGGLKPFWTPGEEGALSRLTLFVEVILSGYKDTRDIPAVDGTSRLSSHLRWGEVSPFRVWQTVENAVNAGHVPAQDGDKFLAEIGWREFSFQLLYFNPKLPTDNLQTRFDTFPWIDDLTSFERWRDGETGYPIVDAGMRELRQTGYMHNRVRMIVASFLVKHLMIDWRKGEAWFWDQLVDADPANNTASWQWVAGCGADAAPYFRIFNPIIQGAKFDPQGEYTKNYVPELTGLPGKHLFSPWAAPEELLRASGVDLGTSYPHPIVDHAFARERALAAFSSL